LRAGKFAALFASTTLILSLLPPTAGAAISIKIAIAYDIGGRGDHGINDAAAKGVDAIKKKYGLSPLSVREMVTNGTEGDRESRLQFLAAANYNLIVAIGSGYAQAVSVVAAANPSTEFALVNDASIGNLNITNLVFSKRDAAYLAGVLAGAATLTNKVGFLGPVTSGPVVSDFQLGLASVNRKAVVKSVLLDSAPANATKALIAQGADIIYSEWTSTSGVEDSVAALTTKKRPIYLIGINPDQYFLLGKGSQQVLIGAVSKRMDLAVADVMTAAINSETIIDVLDSKAGIYGHMYTAKDGGVSIALTALGARYSAKVSAVIAKIKSGKIKLP
jgi:basic membrane protein A and related proteins